MPSVTAMDCNSDFVFLCSSSTLTMAMAMLSLLPSGGQHFGQPTPSALMPSCAALNSTSSCVFSRSAALRAALRTPRASNLMIARMMSSLSPAGGQHIGQSSSSLLMFLSAASAWSSSKDNCASFHAFNNAATMSDLLPRNGQHVAQPARARLMPMAMASTSSFAFVFPSKSVARGAVSPRSPSASRIIDTASSRSASDSAAWHQTRLPTSRLRPMTAARDARSSRLLAFSSRARGRKGWLRPSDLKLSRLSSATPSDARMARIISFASSRSDNAVSKGPSRFG
mmetsp:Transcript_79665/g.221681  ORF Transcript_79665/g.221681 Transcript_79665/m.221681 type:complete len:284 (+) Transcript_79665:138-989(+)